MIGNRVYHYTTMETFFHLMESIRESKDKNSFVFRATNLYFMNDPQEFIYGLKVLMEVIRAIEIDKDVPENKCLSKFFFCHKEKNIEEWSQTLFKSIEEQNEIPYVISFSRHEDSLSMWLNYGDNGKGVCLAFPEYIGEFSEFDINKPCGTKVEITDSLNAHEVFYQSNNIISSDNKTWIYDEIEDLYNKLYWSQIQKGNVKELFALQFAVIRALTIVESPYIKAIEYEGEKESRITKRLSHDYDNDFRNLYFRCNSKGNIIPYVNVEIPITMLDYVRIGPLADIELSKKVINMMKMKYGLKFEIQESRIQYRDY